jgi:hypothetical protein
VRAASRWGWVLGGLLGCAAAHGPVTGDAIDEPEVGPVLDAGRPTLVRVDAALPDWLSDAGALQDGAPQALPVPQEVCNGRDDDADGKRDEGCPILLGEGRDLKIGGGRLVWQQRIEEEGSLWTALLPDGAPELVVRSGWRQVYAATDGQRIVHSDPEGRLFVLVDMRDGSKRVIEPLEPKGNGLFGPSIDGDRVAYAQSSRPENCGGWCDEVEVFLYDLRTGRTQLVAPGEQTIQSLPLLSGNQLVWLDDRYGHHLDQWGGEHWFDVFAAELPYVGEYKRLTFANPRPIAVVGFAAGRLLTREEKQRGLDVYQLLELSSGHVMALDGVMVRGDAVLALSASHLLLQSDPLGRCALSLVRLAGLQATELNTEGQCVDNAVLGDGFVAWLRTQGASSEIYWMDVRDAEQR